MSPRREILKYQAKFVDLDDELVNTGKFIKDQILKCQRFIEYVLGSQKRFQQLELFGKEDFEDMLIVDDQIMTYSERKKLKKKIEKSELDNQNIGWMFSKWAELGLLCWFYDTLLSCGRYSFLQDYAYRYAKLRVSPQGIFLPEFEKKKNKGSNLFEVRVLKSLWPIFGEMSKDTPFGLFIRDKSWLSIFAKTGIDDSPCPGDELQSRVRQFYNLAFKEIVQRDKIDHPKILELIDILEKHPPHLSGQIIVFTGTRIHAAYLAQVIKHKFQHLQRRVVYAYSPYNAAQRKQFDRNLEMFRNNEADFLVTTDYCREGMDIKRAQVCVEYNTTSTNPTKKDQGRGRVGRDINHKFAHIYYLLTRQSGEFHRLAVSGVRSKHMKQLVMQKGETLLPEQLEEVELIKEVNNEK